MINKTAIEFKFDLFGDYKKQFAEYVDYVFNVGKDLDIEGRKALIEELTKSYITTTWERPEGKQLERLGTLLLLEYYTSTKKNKKDEENPVLSTKQVLRRKYNERQMHAGM